jgi:hypothetical protein
MKRGILLFLVAIVIFLIFATARVYSQDRTQIRMKGKEVVTGVVIVDILKDGNLADCSALREQRIARFPRTAAT